MAGGDGHLGIERIVNGIRDTVGGGDPPRGEVEFNDSVEDGEADSGSAGGVTKLDVRRSYENAKEYTEHVGVYYDVGWGVTPEDYVDEEPEEYVSAKRYVFDWMCQDGDTITLADYVGYNSSPYSGFSKKKFATVTTGDGWVFETVDRRDRELVYDEGSNVETVRLRDFDPETDEVIGVDIGDDLYEREWVGAGASDHEVMLGLADAYDFDPTDVALGPRWDLSDEEAEELFEELKGDGVKRYEFP